MGISTSRLDESQSFPAEPLVNVEAALQIANDALELSSSQLAKTHQKIQDLQLDYSTKLESQEALCAHKDDAIRASLAMLNMKDAALEDRASQLAQKTSAIQNLEAMREEDRKKFQKLIYGYRISVNDLKKARENLESQKKVLDLHEEDIKKVLVWSAKTAIQNKARKKNPKGANTVAAILSNIADDDVKAIFDRVTTLHRIQSTTDPLEATIAKLQQEITTLQDHITKHEAYRKEMLKRLTDKQAVIDAQDASLVQAKKAHDIMISDRKTYLEYANRTTKKLEEDRELITQYEEHDRLQKEHLSRQEKTLKERKTAIQAHNKVLAGKDEAIRQLEAELKTCDGGRMEVIEMQKKIIEELTRRSKYYFVMQPDPMKDWLTKALASLDCGGEDDCAVGKKDLKADEEQVQHTLGDPELGGTGVLPHQRPSAKA